jgi:hypothetical protein
VYDAGGDVGGKQYEQCLRCHSYYGFLTSPPVTPSGHADGSATSETDVAAEMNPDNLAHHAVYDVGVNQPIVPDGSTTPAVNPNWKKVTGTGTTDSNGWIDSGDSITLPASAMPGWYAKSGSVYYQVVEIAATNNFRVASTNGNPWDPNATYPNSVSITEATAGLGDTFVPPYGPWSIIRCTECHGSKLTDPLGPHASANLWLLKDGETGLKFEWYDGSSVTKISYNAGKNIFTKEYMCFNCHRADVYPTLTTSEANLLPDYPELSRIAHGDAGTGMWGPCSATGGPGSNEVTTWPQYCRNCHAGNIELGSIHGSNAQNFASPSGNLTDKQGKRFLNGASWFAPQLDNMSKTQPTGLERSTTDTLGKCYTVADTSVESNTVVNSCAKGHDAVDYGTTATYDYDNPG